jgi:hypothetical protein
VPPRRLRSIDAPRNGPQRLTRTVGRRIGRVDPVFVGDGAGHPSPEVGQLASAHAADPVEQHDVASGERAERIEGPWDLGLDVQDGREAVGERLAEVDG